MCGHYWGRSGELMAFASASAIFLCKMLTLSRCAHTNRSARPISLHANYWVRASSSSWQVTILTPFLKGPSMLLHVCSSPLKSRLLLHANAICDRLPISYCFLWLYFKLNTVVAPLEKPLHKSLLIYCRGAYSSQFALATPSQHTSAQLTGGTFTLLSERHLASFRLINILIRTNFARHSGIVIKNKRDRRKTTCMGKSQR